MPRIKGYDYSQPGFYFVTICIENRQNSFGTIENNDVLLSDPGKKIEYICKNFSDLCIGIELDKYQIMPDHIHLIVALYETKDTLGKVIRKFKAKSTQLIRHELGYIDFTWQRNYYEHIIRNDIALGKIRQYMHDNPLQFSIDVVKKVGHQFIEPGEKNDNY